MTSWEISANFVEMQVVFGKVSMKEGNQKKGTSSWNDLQELAKQGWELVSVTPLGVFFLYTFKRPIE